MPGSEPPPGQATTRQRGARFEALAERALQARGLRTLARNFSCRGGEIDLVMRDGDVVIFVEVRYRRSNAYGGAAASIGRDKQRRLQHAAAMFLALHPRLGQLPCRFDVVTFTGTAADPDMQWINGAFSA